MQAITSRTVSAAKTASHASLSPRALVWRRFKRHRMGIVGAVITAIFVFVALFAPLIAPHPYDRTNLFKPTVLPGQLAEHPLGTDELGRDFLSRLIFGSRVSLTVAIAVQVIVLVIGVTLGFMSGWFGGAVDFVISRLLEVVGSLPGLLFQILIVLLLQRHIQDSVLVVVIAVAVLAWPIYVRLVRAQVMSLKEREFVEAARSLGASPSFIATRHILPHLVGPLVVSVTSAIGLTGFITAEATLSFFGYGINEPLPSWGKMIGDSVRFIQRFQYLAIYPVACLMLLILGVSFLGDALRDALDPTSDRAQAK